MTVQYQISPPCDSRFYRLDDGSEINGIGELPVDLNSFREALNDTLWRDHNHPFAFVIRNVSMNEVLLIRDHLGIATLYYCRKTSGVLIVGETIPEVLAQLPQTPPLLEKHMIQLFSEEALYSDETIYQGIYRVEPGHIMRFKPNGDVVKHPFWQLERVGPTLYYPNDQDYLDHFTQLMAESLQNCTQSHENIAAEFSAGLDSCAVYSAARRNNINPKLYMHIGKPDTEPMKNYNPSYERDFIHQYPLIDLQRVNADAFDPIQIFKEYANWFAGPAPYAFFMFANPVHRAVAAGGHPILLSGFGGDQCVSGQIPLNYFLPELIHQKKYAQAWRALTYQDPGANTVLQLLNRALAYAGYMNSNFNAVIRFIKEIRHEVKTRLKGEDGQIPAALHPWHKRYHRSVREAEWFLLQGPGSHEVRMRIEYSSIVSKKMGFAYRYPLLYPKLLEFMQSLPLEQKRREGTGRWLIRRYLAQNMSTDVFSTYGKKEGMGIMPDAFNVYKQNFIQGCYQSVFKDLPYNHLIRHRNPLIELRRCIKAFMLKEGVI